MTSTDTSTLSDRPLQAMLRRAAWYAFAALGGVLIGLVAIYATMFIEILAAVTS